MANLAGPSYESPVRRYIVDSTTNAENTPPPVALNRLKGLLKGNTLITKSQESADPSSPKKTGARKKELAVKIQGGATITLCSSCVESNKIEEKIQPKRRKSVANDDGEEKPKRTNKKKPAETAEVPAPKDKKKTTAKKETAEKVSKPRNTRKKATDNKENELLVDHNADSLSSNEAHAENEHQQLSQDEENNNKKARKPRAVRPKNTSKTASETKETANKPKRPRQRNVKKNTTEENIEPEIENINVTDLVNSINEKNKADAHNNEMSQERTDDPVMEDDHITKRIQKETSKNTVHKKKPKRDTAKKNDMSHENSEEAFKDMNVTDLTNSINEKIKMEEATNSTFKESSFGDDMHMEHSQNSSSSIQHKKQKTYETNAYKDKLRHLDQRMKMKNTSQQNSESNMMIYEQNKTQDDNAGSQEMTFNSSVPNEASQSEIMDSQPLHNTRQLSKNQGAIKKVILTKNKQMNVTHEKTSEKTRTQKQPKNDAKTKKLDESKSKKTKKNVSSENVESEYHAENLNNLNLKSESNHNHDISTSNIHGSSINNYNYKEYDINDAGKKTAIKNKLGLAYELQVVEPDSSRCTKKSKSKRDLSQEENQVSSAETKRERRKSEKQLKKQRGLNKAFEELNKQFANIQIGKIDHLHIGSQLANLDSDSSSECSSSCSCWDSESSCTCGRCAMDTSDDDSSLSPSSSDGSDFETVCTSSTESSSSESETTESESSEGSERDCKRKHQHCKK